MIDTQPIQAAPQCISGVAEVAAVCARQDADHCTHVLEVTTYFPLDVATISRMMEGLSEREGIDFIETDQMHYLRVVRPDDYNVQMLNFDAGEHLAANGSLRKHLGAFRRDDQWVRRVVEQHEVMQVAAASKIKRLELEHFLRRLEIPKARVQSTLNDLGAGQHIAIDVDESMGHVHYVFPDFDYPKARFLQNMKMLEDEGFDHAGPAGSRSIWLALAALCAALIAGGMLLFFVVR